MKYMNHSGLSQTPEATISGQLRPARAATTSTSHSFILFWDRDSHQLGLGEDGGELTHGDGVKILELTGAVFVACMSADLSCNHSPNPRPPQVRHSARGWTDVFNYSSIRGPTMQVFPEPV
jgi:hypothetical protein